MTEAEIRRCLQLIRYTPASIRCGRKAPSLNSLATATGLTKQTIHRIANGYPISPKSQAALSDVLTRQMLHGVRSQAFVP